MKWGSGSSRNGDMRVIKKYAWFPIRIKSRWEHTTEWRWLELVKIRQEYHTNADYDFMIIRDIKVYLFGGFWVNESFLEFDLAEKRDEKLKKLGL